MMLISHLCQISKVLLDNRLCYLLFVRRAPSKKKLPEGAGSLYPTCAIVDADSLTDQHSWRKIEHLKTHALKNSWRIHCVIVTYTCTLDIAFHISWTDVEGTPHSLSNHLGGNILSYSGSCSRRLCCSNELERVSTVRLHSCVFIF